jgi:hypothetical protein
LQARHLELQTLINTLPDPAPFPPYCGDHLDELNKQYQQLQTNLHHLEQMRADSDKISMRLPSFDEGIIRFSSFLNDSLQEYISLPGNYTKQITGLTRLVYGGLVHLTLT